MMKNLMRFAVTGALLAISVNVCIVLYDVCWRPVREGEFEHDAYELDLNQLVKNQGYHLESHTVTTEDGYVLTLHRIPHGKTISSNSTNRPAILLIHGLCESSAAYLSATPENALPYYLVENGYDVWLGNARGNYYSRKHKTINPDTNPREFYNFTWNEIGYYDLPAMIDFIRKSTKQERIYYAGHSQGTVSFFAMLSERPEYNEKIRVMLALGPVVYGAHGASWGFKVPAFFQSSLPKLLDYFEMYEMLPKSSFMMRLNHRLCHSGTYNRPFCKAVLRVIGGYNDKFDSTLMAFMAHTPAGASLKQWWHYTQIVNTDEFEKYDYGLEENLLRYGQETPPKYNYKNIKAPIALFYGKSDWCTAEKDVSKLHSNLPNVILKHQIEDENFAHFDFLGCENIVDLLYARLLDIMKKY